MTIFDLVKATEIAAYWETLSQDREPYLLTEMFPDDKKLGLDLSYIKGSSGLPAVLKTSAFDVKAIPRTRLGFEKLTAEMPFFKESLYIDEALRQELNKVLETGNQAYIEVIVNRIFADEIQLLEAASAARERMRAMALTTGAITLAANGQAYTYDYQMPATHKRTNQSFNNADYDVCSYINETLDIIEDDTGVRPSRGVVSRNQWNNMKKNTVIAKNVYVLTNGVGTINDNTLRDYLFDQTGVEFVVYSKRYKDEAGATNRFIPDDLVVLFPAGALGRTWFGTTPEESDLMTGSAANVAITDTGVAVTTVKMTDPVYVETKVTQICLPSFEAADQVAIIDASTT
jgi:hypothetical protein